MHRTQKAPTLYARQLTTLAALLFALTAAACGEGSSQAAGAPGAAGVPDDTSTVARPEAVELGAEEQDAAEQAAEDSLYARLTAVEKRLRVTEEALLQHEDSLGRRTLRLEIMVGLAIIALITALYLGIVKLKDHRYRIESVKADLRAEVQKRETAQRQMNERLGRRSEPSSIPERTGAQPRHSSRAGTPDPVGIPTGSMRSVPAPSTNVHFAEVPLTHKTENLPPYGAGDSRPGYGGDVEEQAAPKEHTLGRLLREYRSACDGELPAEAFATSYQVERVGIANGLERTTDPTVAPTFAEEPRGEYLVVTLGDSLLAFPKPALKVDGVKYRTLALEEVYESGPRDSGDTYEVAAVEEPAVFEYFNDGVYRVLVRGRLVLRPYG